MLIGGAVAFCTTASDVPQLRKCWTGETDDLSLKMLLATGLSLWMVYGFIRADIVIIIAMPEPSWLHPLFQNP